jgi:hypothetical protein
MPLILSLIDSSAHARGSGWHPSNSHVSGWEVLCFVVFIILVIVTYQIAKQSLAAERRPEILRL